MKKIISLLTFIFILSLKIVLGFNIPYQSLIDYDDQNLIIKVKNINNETKFYSCHLETKNCSLIDSQKLNLSSKSNNFNLFPSEKKEKFIWQYYNKNKRKFITFFVNSKTFSLLPVNRKITNVYWSKNQLSNFIILSGNDIYVYNDGKINQLRLKNIKGEIKVSPNLKFILYQNNINQLTLLNTENKSIIEINFKNIKANEFINDNQIVFQTTDRGFDKIWLYNINSQNLESIFNEDFLIDNFLVDNQKIYFIANKENYLKWNLYEFDIYSKNYKKIIDNVAYDFKLLKLKNFLIAKISDNLPPRIILINLDNFQVEKFNLDIVSEEVKLGEILKVEDIYSVLLKPENFANNKQYDLVVWLHGGPIRQASLGYHPYLSYGIFDYILEQLRKENKLIVKIDYVGSWGYGLDYQQRLKNNIGKADVESILKVINKLKTDYQIRNIFLLGNSYGGYLVLKLIYEYPKQFAGAISVNAVSDWWSLIKDIPSSPFRFYFGGLPSKSNKYLYDQASVYLNPERLIDKKILLIHAKDDEMVPFYQTRLFYLKYHKIANVQFKLYPDENHIIISRNNLEDMLKSIKEFTKTD